MIAVDKLASAVRSRDGAPGAREFEGLASTVRGAVGEQLIWDIHTHLYPPSHRKPDRSAGYDCDEERRDQATQRGRNVKPQVNAKRQAQKSAGDVCRRRKEGSAQQSGMHESLPRHEDGQRGRQWNNYLSGENARKHPSTL